ncbi:PREDICTED: serine protease 27-like [Cyprinodon variegatus]|uniref:serine protease 27-like n=1 Tax=Cyprinodon variegatus TaxID=28743 RepID=UPI00074294E3|nr:PREDICTED: serine protease 27-like [Cyprinodon variegatus]
MLLFKMSLQRLTCGITVIIILFCKGIKSEPACARSSINSRILGGQEASPGSWPWHVAITTKGRIFCQGSLITDEWVLTAARCFKYSYLSGAILHLGAKNHSRFGEVTRRVYSIVCHQDYDAFYLNRAENDICLLKMSAPVNFTDYIHPVCLASENSTFYDGTASWVTSFGEGCLLVRPGVLPDTDVDKSCTVLIQNESKKTTSIPVGTVVVEMFAVDTVTPLGFINLNACHKE